MNSAFYKSVQFYNCINISSEKQKQIQGSSVRPVNNSFYESVSRRI